MRLANKGWLLGALSGIALVAAIPAIGQDDPKSLLPPGFGDPAPAPDKGSNTNPAKPVDMVPDSILTAPGSQTASDTDRPADDLENSALADGEELPVDIMSLEDLPAGVRRSTAQIGILGPTDGDMGPSAFGQGDGRYLSYLMRKTRAPIASRWASIILRRALLSRVDTPRGVTGADWAAERAWLLLRMGEAESARALVQAVDVDRYTPKMFQVAMQSALASADPAGLCAMVEPATAVSKEPAWPFAKAMCSALSGESAQASALIDIAKSKPSGRGIDGLLAEKVVGAGVNTRRAVVIQWDDTAVLTAWRIGLASATAVEIPAKIAARNNPRVKAWNARSPLVPVEKRVGDADVAAALGVLSSSALVDFYGQVADATDVSSISGTPADSLRKAFSEPESSARLDAMRALWSEQSLDAFGKYARLILTARAAARIAAEPSLDGDAAVLIQSMMSAGLDVQAAKWARIAGNGNSKDALTAWGVLAVGAPGRVVDWSVSRIGTFQRDVGGEDGLRGRFLFASMAGLGRMSPPDVSEMARDLAIPIDRESAWTRALDRAVKAREPGTVVLLCALGLGVSDWQHVSPSQLYHSISALNAVGLGADARMIAAEAITRS